MTVYQDGAYLSKIIEGAAAQGAAPLVFWDGMGLEQTGSGIYVYARELASALKDIGISPTLVGSEESAKNFDDLACFVPKLIETSGRLGRAKIVWPQLVGSIFLKAARKNRKSFVFHGLSNIDLPFGPLGFMGMRRVVTVHDLIPLLAPGGVSSSYYLQFKMALPFVLTSADAVVCVSEWTRQTIEERYPSYASKLVVIKNGVTSHEPRPKTRVRGEQTEALCVSRFETYKKTEFLLDILAVAPNSLRLTIVTDQAGETYFGQQGRGFVERGQLLVKRGIGHKDLMKLYNEVDVYIHPSEFEGFCLPAAEALQAGTPVVYQAGSGIDEVCGHDVAIPLSEKASPHDWVNAIEEAVKLGENGEFRNRLKDHLRTLPTWKDAATTLKSLYNDLV